MLFNLYTTYILILSLKVDVCLFTQMIGDLRRNEGCLIYQTTSRVIVGRIHIEIHDKDVFCTLVSLWPLSSLNADLVS